MVNLSLQMNDEDHVTNHSTQVFSHSSSQSLQPLKSIHRDDDDINHRSSTWSIEQFSNHCKCYTKEENINIVNCGRRHPDNSDKQNTFYRCLLPNFASGRDLAIKLSVNHNGLVPLLTNIHLICITLKILNKQNKINIFYNQYKKYS